MGIEGTGLPDDGDLDWNELYTLYGPALRRAIGRSAPAADIEDILQNTFVRFVKLRARGQLDVSRPLLPLLLTLARRARIDHWRRRPRETTVVHLPDNGHAVDVPGAEMEAVESIADAFASLSPRDKRLLFRCEVEGACRKAVGMEEVLSSDALKQAYSRARRRFRSAYLAILEEQGVLSAGGVVLALRRRLQRLALRARLQRSAGERGVEELMRVGLGITAAAGITLAVAAGPLAARTDGPLRVVALGPAAALASSEAESKATPAQNDAVPTTLSPGVSPIVQQLSRQPEPNPPGVELRRADGSVVATPDNPSFGIYLEWSDPAGDGHGTAGAEFKCSGSKVMTFACPILRQLPGTSAEDG